MKQTTYLARLVIARSSEGWDLILMVGGAGNGIAKRRTKREIVRARGQAARAWKNAFLIRHVALSELTDHLRAAIAWADKEARSAWDRRP